MCNGFQPVSYTLRMNWAANFGNEALDQHIGPRGLECDDLCVAHRIGRLVGHLGHDHRRCLLADLAELYDRPKAGLASGRLVKHSVPFEEAVDNSLAEEAVRADPSPL
jgi:hypothetical protein